MDDYRTKVLGDAQPQNLRNVVPIGGAGHAGAAEFEHKPSLCFVWLRGRRHVISVPRAQRVASEKKRLSNRLRKCRAVPFPAGVLPERLRPGSTLPSRVCPGPPLLDGARSVQV